VELGPPSAPIGLIDFEAELPEEDFGRTVREFVPHHVLQPYLADRLPAGELVPLLEEITTWRMDVRAILNRLEAKGRVTDRATRRWWAAKIADFVLAGRLKEDGAGIISRGRKLTNFEPLVMTKREREARAYRRSLLHEQDAARLKAAREEAARTYPELLPP
jgi:hypothetical protein